MPPTGARRFGRPEAPEAWTGVRAAVTFGAAAPQPAVAPADATAAPLSQALGSLLYPFSGSPVGGVAVNEDCLFLNVWAPTRRADPRPVMVWLHGGAFTHGAGSEPPFWADRLATRQDVVVVTVNHRLGALGYFPIDEDGAGQAGMLDIVAALEWVRDNIAAFGGNPDAVTVFGQSGGGMKVQTLLAMPTAVGLFHRAIVMSAPSLQLPLLAESAPVASALFDVLGIDDGDVQALRDAPAERIVAAQELAARVAGLPFGMMPVIDGDIIQPGALLDASPHLPLMIGCTSEEAAMFLVADPAYETLSQEGLVERLSDQFGDRAAEILGVYEDAFPGVDPRVLLRRIASDRDLRVSVVQALHRRRAASRAPLYSYVFDYDPRVLGGAIGATHSGELAFVFDNADRVPLSGTRPDRDALGEQMSAAWAAFARSGAPGTAAFEWPEYSSERMETVVFDGGPPAAVDDPDGDRLRLMAQFPSRIFPRDHAAGVTVVAP